MSYLEKIKEVYAMVEDGKFLEAFRKYYSDHVVMEELGEEPRKGKEENEKAQIHFLETMTVNNSGVEAITADEANKITLVESWFDVTEKQSGKQIHMEQVGVQRWDGDHIVYEKFYHK